MRSPVRSVFRGMNGVPQRQGYRGDDYVRNLVTRYGLLEVLQVPWLAEGPVDFQLFNKYERRRSPSKKDGCCHR
ncbi:MAG: hypothetical protein ACE5IA_06980 [Dehalococcoidia bacterium]